MRLAILLVLAACGPQNAPVGVTPIGNQAMAAGPGALPLGDYACRITEQGYEYPPFRCVAYPERGRTMLEKVEGSVRFRGVAIATRDGSFELHGEVFCPFGDCTEPVRAVFRPIGGGGYEAAFASRQTGPSMLVRLEPIVYAGGYAYGGAAYGGGMYGGRGYGYAPYP